MSAFIQLTIGAGNKQKHMRLEVGSTEDQAPPEDMVAIGAPIGIQAHDDEEEDDEINIHS